VDPLHRWTTTPGIPDISIGHEPKLKGAFKAQKGLKIKDYHTTEKE
jgi:hypothetical protein